MERAQRGTNGATKAPTNTKERYTHLAYPTMGMANVKATVEVIEAQSRPKKASLAPAQFAQYVLLWSIQVAH